MTVHQLSRTDARRIAVRAQLLESSRPTDLVEMVRHLNLLQLDPTAAIAPNADLVASSHLGSTYSRSDLVEALESHTLIELLALIRPKEDLALFRAEMAECPGRGELRPWQSSRRDWVKANEPCRLDILDRVDEQPERDQAPRLHGAARRGGDHWAKGPRATLESGGAGLPRRIRSPN